MATEHNHANEADCRGMHQLLCELFQPDTPPERVAAIRQELASCPDCLRQLESEEAIRGLVRDCCGQAHAPRVLRERIISSISYTEVRIQRR